MKHDLKDEKSAPGKFARRDKPARGNSRNQASSSPRQRKSKLSRKEWLTILLPMFSVVAAVVVALLLLDEGTTYELKQGGSQYYAGNTAKIQSGSELKRNEDGTAVLVQDHYATQTDLPIYIENTRKVVCPMDMLYVTPRDGSYGRLVYFSEVECKANGVVTVSRDGKTWDPGRGFLYDGGDLYLFLEPMVLNFNGYSMEVPALSYIEAVYGGYMMVFNYNTKECFMELSDGTGTAQPPSGDYQISLLGDSMTLYDGSKMLLATRPDLFDPIE